MDFKVPVRKLGDDDKEKELPGFRPSSELPEHTEVTKAVPTDIEQSANDPTDLMLDREKESLGIRTENTTDEKPVKPKKKASKKQIIVLLVILAIVALGAVATLLLPKYLEKDDSPATPTENAEQVKNDDKPALIPAPITGTDVSAEIAARPVTAIMIENSVEARPQSGLYDADMVVEAIAEGGITRFVSLFQSGQPSVIGPIRSARPYYVDIAKTFDAAYVHAGGSPDALARITELGVKDMSAFENNGTYYREDSRSAPHDLYSGMSKIDERRTALGFTKSEFTSWKHKSDSAQTPTASTIDFAISSPLYNPTFTYDSATNSYLRSQDGEPHTDQLANKQINPKVVLAIITNRSQEGIYSNYRLTGTGEIRVFQDGIASEGTWSKDSVTSQFVFKDKNGLEFVFNKGQIWVSLIESLSDINYAP